MLNRYAPPVAAVDDAALAGGVISAEMIEALRGTKGWVMLIGILFFVGAGFSVLGGLGVGFGGMMTGRAAGNAPPPGFFLGMAAMYIVIAAIDIFLGVYLVRYSSAIGRLMQSGAAGEMEVALQAQRKFWKLAGVLSLILIVVMLLGIVAAISLPAYLAYNARLH